MFGKKTKGPEKEAEVDLNRVVTPMLDMTFQILFFLIMNFRMPTPEGQIDLLLPKDDEGAPSLPQEDKLDKPEIDEYLLRITIYERAGDDGEAQGSITDMKWRKKGEKIDDFRKTGSVRITARLLDVRIQLTTQDGYLNSNTIACSVHRESSTNQMLLTYLFKSDIAKPEISDSQSHLGAGVIEIPKGRVIHTMSGKYWTNRNWHREGNTAGLLTLRKRSSHA